MSDEQKRPKLTNKQAAFVREYLVDLNATQAAIRAGYSEDTASVIGSENLGKPHIQEAVAEAMQARQKRTEITADRVLEQIAKIAFHDIRDVVKWNENGTIEIRPSDEIDGTLINEISETFSEGGRTRKVKLANREKMLELLSRHLGIDKLTLAGQVNHNHGGEITKRIVADERSVQLARELFRGTTDRTVGN